MAAMTNLVSVSLLGYPLTTGTHRSPHRRRVASLPGLGICLLLTACSSIDVDTIRYTTEPSPPRPSSASVLTLSDPPGWPYKKLAQISARGPRAELDDLQEEILERAAELGAEAVIFDKEITHVHRDVAYRPTYRSYGYYDPWYRPDAYGIGRRGLGYGSGYGAPVPHETVTVIESLKGTAIIYGESDTPSP